MTKLYNILFETGPSAQSAIPTLGDDPRRVSRTGVAAQDAGFLDIVVTMGLDMDSPKGDWDSTFPQEDGMEHKITP
jgi:uncharacterized ferredoxin-like protein